MTRGLKFDLTGVNLMQKVCDDLQSSGIKHFLVTVFQTRHITDKNGRYLDVVYSNVYQTHVKQAQIQKPEDATVQ